MSEIVTSVDFHFGRQTEQIARYVFKSQQTFKNQTSKILGQLVSEIQTSMNFIHLRTILCLETKTRERLDFRQVKISDDCTVTV